MISRKNGRGSLKTNKKTIDTIFEAKQKRREYLAKLPIEEKIKILVELQKMAVPILKARGLKRNPWRLG
jgi:hypothetical protein